MVTLRNFKTNHCNFSCDIYQGPLNGGDFKRGEFPDLDLSFPFVLFGDFPDYSGIFPICSGMVRGFSRFVLVLFLGPLRAPTRNSPERVRDTIWTFPEKKVENPPVWEPPGLASLKSTLTVREHPHKMKKLRPKLRPRRI